MLAPKDALEGIFNHDWEEPDLSTDTYADRHTDGPGRDTAERADGAEKPPERSENSAPKFTHMIDQVMNSLDDGKAEDIVRIDLTGKSSIADTMVIASGRSQRHVGSIADHVVRDLRKGGFGRARVEGLPHCDWVLVDAGDVIVHIFRPEVRDFYNLEKMWTADIPAERAAV